MNPATVRGHGGFPRLRHRIKGWGAFNVSSGTPKRRTLRALRKMVKDLQYEGRFDYLGLLKDEVLTPLQLQEHLRGKDYASLPPATSFARIVDARDSWLAGLRVTHAHRKAIELHLRRLLGLDANARATDLPGLLQKLKDADEARGAFRSFNYARAVALAYLRDHGGQRTDLYAATLAIRVLPTARKRQGHPCTPAEAWTLACDLGPVWGRVWLAQCLTGMGGSELWGEWAPEDGGLAIRGTKRAGRHRLVPLVYLLERPPLSLSRGIMLFRKALKAASRGTVQPYDGRRSYLKWLALAGIVPIHQDAYAGHGPKSMTALYQQGNVGPYLAADAAALLKVVRTLPAALRARVRKVFGAASQEAKMLT